MGTVVDVLEALPDQSVIRARVVGLDGETDEIRPLMKRDDRWWEPPGRGGWSSAQLFDVVLPVRQAEWPRHPLPTAPGTVIIATVRDVADQKLMYTQGGDTMPWASVFPIDGSHWHRASDITDWRFWVPGGEG